VLAPLWLAALLSVVLEGGAIDARSLQAALASCNEVLEQRCEAGPPSPEAPPAAQPTSSQRDAFYVSLRADEALSSVQIEVHRGAPSGPLSHARSLVFEANTQRDERARTIGLVVAAHVLAVLQKERVRAAAAVVPPPPARRYRLDVAALVGSALDAGPPRGGLMLRGAMLARSLPLGLVASVRGAYRPGQPRVSWLGATLGVLTHQQLGRAPVALEGRLEAVGQRTDVRARDGSLREKSNAFRVGGQLGADLLLQVGRSSWLFVGGEGNLLRPRVDIRLRGRVVGSEPLWAWTALLGLCTQW
jgi:hypothetical protein